MNRLQRGFWAGLLATGPMTIFLFRLFQKFPSLQNKALPPALITQDLSKKAGLASPLSSSSRENLTLLGHFAYAGVCGALYSLLMPPAKVKPSTRGMFFGLGIWGASYLGWIPALHLRAQAQKSSLSRNAMMVVAHAIWGASLGSIDHDLQNKKTKMLDGKETTGR